MSKKDKQEDRRGIFEYSIEYILLRGLYQDLSLDDEDLQQKVVQ